MALYQYLCESCGEKIEVIAKMDSEKLRKCSCGGNLRQLYFPAALFWGKGWGSAPFCFRRKFAYPHSDSKKP